MALNISKESMVRVDGRLLLIKLRTFIALFALATVFSFLSPNFLTVGNFVIMAKHVAINAILALGMTFVVLTGGIDLSVGAVVGLAGMIAGGLIHEGLVLNFLGITIYFSVPVVVAITLALGTLVGLVNGILVTRFKVAAFIATLGTMYVARGFALLRSDGKTFPNLVGEAAHGNTGFPLIGAGTFLGVPFLIWIMIILALASAYTAKKTPFGRHVYAVGGNENAARLSGVRVPRVKLAVYMFSGFTAAVVGLVVSSQLVASHPATGESFEMNAIAAAVLGGTSLAGGRGGIGGSVVGAFVIGVLEDGLVMLGVSSFWQKVIKGLVIIAAVVADQIQGDVQRRASFKLKEGKK
jgi:erythritol transport system permease protein